MLQPDIWMTARGVTMTFWGSYDLTDVEGTFPGNYHEWDLFLDVQLGKYGPLWFTGELFYGSFPTSSGQGSSTAEIGGWVTADFPGSPTATVFWDIWALHGIYANFSLSQEFPLSMGTICLASSVGYGDDRHNLWSGVPQAGGWLDFSATLGYSVNPIPALTINPAIHYSELLQEEIRTFYDLNGKESFNLFFSLNAAFTLEP